MISLAVYLLLVFVFIFLLAVLITRNLAKLSRLKYFINRDELPTEETLASVKRRTIETEFSEPSRPSIIAFFHPYCHAGGGGERVLWMAIKALQEKFQGHERLIRIIVFTGDVGIPPEDFYTRAKVRFNISIDRNIDFIYLKNRFLVEESSYPRFTLILQSLGGLLLGLEAFSFVSPDIFIDTMGYAFAYPLFKYLGLSSVVAYVHYPTISQDMLDLVSRRSSAFNNDSFIAQSLFLSKLKEFYYNYFSELYGFVGRCSDVVMANSSWTKMHLDSIWDTPAKIQIVYPPCDTAAFSSLPFEDREPLIVSISQFRPEKDHILQIHAFKSFTKSPRFPSNLKLMMIGSCRHKDDFDRVDNLRNVIEELELSDKVMILVNVPFPELQKIFSKAKVGLHTMSNEHFGIGIVEFMAAGCITVAHKSGGPMMDIVTDGESGFLATTPEEYCSVFEKVFSLTEEECYGIQEKARARANSLFSDEIFKSKFISHLKPLLEKLKIY